MHNNADMIAALSQSDNEASDRKSEDKHQKPKNAGRMQSPQSCDTFVVLPPFSQDGSVIFGKNSDRPMNEVQEVVYIKGGIRPPKLKCTYIMIDQSAVPINSVILSKPAWMWGAEMGANDKKVAIGNEAVWTNHTEADGDSKIKRLLGMDLVRLGLERGNSATEALDVIISLLEQHGQGGPCAENDRNFYYHNSFLIADENMAWVLETCGKFWVAERILSGYRNISNGLTITTKFDRHSEDLHEKTIHFGLWDGQGQFNFSKIFAAGGDLLRQIDGGRMLEEGCRNYRFDVHKMMYILRQKENRICRGCEDDFPTQGSQVSRLSADISVHYFTATPDTSLSLFKPFVFTPGAHASEYTESPDEGLREHFLYRLHKENVIQKNNKTRIANKFQSMEVDLFSAIDECIAEIESGIHDLSTLDGVMYECVLAEIDVYHRHDY